MKKCNDCQKEEKHFDHCDNCLNEAKRNQRSKEFCYDCLGRIEKHLYCEPCYRKKENLKDTDKIVRSN